MDFMRKSMLTEDIPQAGEMPTATLSQSTRMEIDLNWDITNRLVCGRRRDR